METVWLAFDERDRRVESTLKIARTHGPRLLKISAFYTIHNILYLPIQCDFYWRVGNLELSRIKEMHFKIQIFFLTIVRFAFVDICVTRTTIACLHTC